MLVDEVLHFFREGTCGAEALALDCTLGGGGHAHALLCASSTLRLIGFDCDPLAVKRAHERLSGFASRTFLVNENFSNASAVLRQMENGICSRLSLPSGPLRFDFILADLGLSSDQLNDEGRGFAFAMCGPLDMRMSPDLSRTAADVLNTYQSGELKRVFLRGGLSPAESSRVVNEILKKRPLVTTGDFARVCEAALPRYSKGQRRRHPATVPFQAVRIEVNSEFENLEAFLDDAPAMLAKGGRLAVISFHSLEDRIVAGRMRRLARVRPQPRSLPVHAAEPGFGRLLTPHSVTPGVEEEGENVRSRSARLRVFERSGVSEDGEVL